MNPEVAVHGGAAIGKDAPEVGLDDCGVDGAGGPKASESEGVVNAVGHQGAAIFGQEEVLVVPEGVGAFDLLIDKPVGRVPGGDAGLPAHGDDAEPDRVIDACIPAHGNGQACEDAEMKPGRGEQVEVGGIGEEGEDDFGREWEELLGEQNVPITRPVGMDGFERWKLVGSSDADEHSFMVRRCCSMDSRLLSVVVCHVDRARELSMTMAPAQRSFGSDALTEGVRVVVAPSYLADRSEPKSSERGRGAGRYVFSYRIRISNESNVAIQLLSRHWIIVDGNGERSEVKGDGVVGQQPVLAPGQSFEYSSYCPLATSWGTMEGTYQFERISAELEGGAKFEARVARFFLVSNGDEAPGVADASVGGGNGGGKGGGGGSARRVDSR